MYKLFLGISLLFSTVVFADQQSGCWYLRPDAPEVTLPANLKSVVVDQYFRISYPFADPMFADADGNGIPDVVQKQIPVLQKSRHFLETELGWKMPSSRREFGRIELDVYFIQAGRRFGGTVRTDPALAIVMNRRTLSSPDFAALWVHQFAHASQTQYRTSGEYWFFEATAGWLEGQFQGYSAATRKAQQMKLDHPETSLLDVSASSGLGASRLLEVIARQNPDVIRQVWDQWAYSNELRADEVLSSVLALNHMPDLESFLLNYYLLSTAAHNIDTDSIEVNLAPFSAALFNGLPSQNSGGGRLSFVPETEDRYSTSLLFFSQAEKGGTLAMKKGQSGASTMLIPYTGMDHYRFMVVNAGAFWLQGKLKLQYDSAIPGVLEYFRVNNDEGGVQIEWKTAKEDGVAFWNLYRLEGGRKQLLNDFPIPAAVQSDEGVHYMYFDSSDASFYSLEAITSEGLASPLATAETPQ